MLHCLTHLSVLCFRSKGQLGNPGVGSGQLGHLGNSVLLNALVDFGCAVRKNVQDYFFVFTDFVVFTPLKVTVRKGLDFCPNLFTNLYQICGQYLLKNKNVILSVQKKFAHENLKNGRVTRIRKNMTCFH